MPQKRFAVLLSVVGLSLSILIAGTAACSDGASKGSKKGEGTGAVAEASPSAAIETPVATAPEEGDNVNPTTSTAVTNIPSADAKDQQRKAQSIFSLYEQNKLAKNQKHSGAIDKKIKDLALGLTPKANVSETIDLYASDFRKIGEDKYRVYYLFKITEPIKKDYSIFLHANVDDAHVKDLPPDRRQYKGMNWDFKPSIPTTQWEPGELTIITTEVTGKPIPYNLYSGFFLGNERMGKGMEMGWVNRLETGK